VLSRQPTAQFPLPLTRAQYSFVWQSVFAVHGPPVPCVTQRPSDVHVWPPGHAGPPLLQSATPHVFDVVQKVFGADVQSADVAHVVERSHWSVPALQTRPAAVHADESALEHAGSA
jgi:hypothetical protein